MSERNILNITSRSAFREWLMQNANSETECWVPVKRGRPIHDDCLWYLDAVEEALCFGWIDSTARTIEGVAMQRFSPRRKNSAWTELNKQRVRRLEALGLMTMAGRKVLPPMGVRSFKIDSDIEKALKEAKVWTKFKKFPPLYQRIRAYNISFAKTRYPKAYHRSLSHLIAETAKGKMYGEWNDYGRLLD